MTTEQDTIEQYFGTPPGPDGYLVIATRWPTIEWWRGAVLYEREDGAIVMPPVADRDEYDAKYRRLSPDEAHALFTQRQLPRDGGSAEWTRHHLSVYHGWEETRIDQWFADELSFCEGQNGEKDDAHWLDHIERERELPIPHTHMYGDRWAIAHNPTISSEIARALITILKETPV